MTRYNRVIYAALIFLFLLTNVSAAIDTVVLQLDGQNYDYAVIGRTYDMFVAGDGLQNISDSQLTIITNNGNVSHYTFVPGNIAGTRTFGTEDNAFKVSVLSEADELADSIESVVIDITDHSSSVKINGLDLDKKIIRNFNFDLDEVHGVFNLDNLLDGITFDLSFNDGSAYPKYNTLVISSSTAVTLLQNIISFNGFSFTVDDVNAEPSLLNQVLDKYDANDKYDFNARAIKTGNDFFFSTDNEGYADLDGSDLENLQQIIDDKIKFVNPDEVIDVLLPFEDFSEFKKFIDFDIYVDSSNLKMEDGTYQLVLKYTDKFGNNGTMPFKVILDVTNIGSQENVSSEGIVTFNDIVIKKTLEKIENLPPGISLTAVLFGNVKPSTSFVSAPSDVKSLNYINLTSNDSGITGSFDLYFKIAKTSIPSNAKDRVQLYVQEGASWTPLPTELINETTTDYEYKGIIPHFSNFLIGYTQESSSTGGGGGRRNAEEEVGAPGNVNNQTSGLPGPINLGNPSQPEESPGLFSIITGAVIGALGTTGGVIAVIFIVGIVGLLIFLKVGRNKRNKSKKNIQETQGKNADDTGDKDNVAEKIENNITDNNIKEDVKASTIENVKNKKKKKRRKKKSKKKKLNDRGDKIGKT